MARSDDGRRPPGKGNGCTGLRGATAGGGDYEVGYGKPPVGSRWGKGQSGNPYGRPRKKDKDPFATKVNPVRDIMFEELARKVSIGEGGATVQMEAFRASTRSAIVGAIKGNRFQQKLVSEWAKAAEASRRAELEEGVICAAKYKEKWSPIFARALEGGNPEPSQLPHPDHVDIDPKTGELILCGPCTRADKKAWDHLKFQLRGTEMMLNKQRARAALNPRLRHEQEAVKLMEENMRQREAEVPPGWNWRDELGWEEAYAERMYSGQ